MVPLKYLSNIWKTLEMPLINCEVSLILAWFADCGIVYTNIAHQGATFVITEAKLYAPVVTLSTQDNAKLLLQLKSGFKRTISWNKSLSNPELLPQDPNLNHIIEPSFQGVNRLCVWHLKLMHKEQIIKKYYIPNVEIKDCNVMIDGKDLFDQPVKSDKVTYDNIRKIATGQGDD